MKCKNNYCEKSKKRKSANSPYICKNCAYKLPLSWQVFIDDLPIECVHWFFRLKKFSCKNVREKILIELNEIDNNNLLLFFTEKEIKDFRQLVDDNKNKRTDFPVPYYKFQSISEQYFNYNFRAVRLIEQDINYCEGLKEKLIEEWQQEILEEIRKELNNDQ